MTYAGAILLIAIGAILRYALNAHVKGVDIDTVGLILIIAGLAGFVVALFQDLIWNERWRRRERIAEEAVAGDRVVQQPVAADRVVEQPVRREYR